MELLFVNKGRVELWHALESESSRFGSIGTFADLFSSLDTAGDCLINRTWFNWDWKLGGSQKASRETSMSQDTTATCHVFVGHTKPSILHGIGLAKWLGHGFDLKCYIPTPSWNPAHLCHCPWRCLWQHCRGKGALGLKLNSSYGAHAAMRWIT